MRSGIAVLLIGTTTATCAELDDRAIDGWDGDAAKVLDCKGCDDGPGGGPPGVEHISPLPDLSGDWTGTASSDEHVGTLGIQIAAKTYPARFDVSLDLLEDEGIFYAFDGTGVVAASGHVTMTGWVFVEYPDGSTAEDSGREVITAEYSSDKDILEGTASFTEGEHIYNFSASR